MLPLLWEVALLGPAAVSESDWDFDEQPGFSSLLDVWKGLCHNKTPCFTWIDLVEAADVQMCAFFYIYKGFRAWFTQTKPPLPLAPNILYHSPLLSSPDSLPCESYLSHIWKRKHGHQVKQMWATAALLHQNPIVLVEKYVLQQQTQKTQRAPGPNEWGTEPFLKTARIPSHCITEEWHLGWHFWISKVIINAHLQFLRDGGMIWRGKGEKKVGL